MIKASTRRAADNGQENYCLADIDQTKCAKAGKSSQAGALIEEYLTAYLDTPFKATKDGMFAAKRAKNA